jgi:starvation-inducible outer membrane lipoprotein
MKKLILLSITALALSACGLTPKQLQAVDGAMCTKTSGYGVSNTTVIVGGASKSQGVVVKGEDCSVATAGFAK